jgi:tetratricopeptide (TPR) repeat protein
MRRRTRRPWAALAVALAALAGCNAQLTPEARRLLQAGKLAYEKGEDRQAVRHLDAFLADNARSRRADEALYYRGLARYRLGELPAAREDLAAALDRTRHKTLRLGARVALGDLAYDSDDMPGAEAHYRSALEDAQEREPPLDHVHYRLGSVLQRQGRWADADLHFDRVIYLFEGSELAQRAARRVRCRAWTVQAGAYSNKAGAEAAAADLRRAGAEAAVVAGREGGGLIFRVLVGRHAGYEEALAALPAVRRRRPDAFVTPVR